MRILVATYSTHRIGGIETYLSDIIPALRAAGHTVAVACEEQAQGSADSLAKDQALEVICAAEAGEDALLDGIRRWRPDLIYLHGMNDPRLEAHVAQIAPTVFFVHNYHGTCVSGAKRFAFPMLRPCARKFGAACLLQYYPRRCGGLNPLTMLRQFFMQRRRLRTVRCCAAVVTHSFHMYSEYARHGVPLDRLHRFVYFSPNQRVPRDAQPTVVPLPVLRQGTDAQVKLNPWQRSRTDPLRLTFAGRLDQNKGVHLLIAAAPAVARRLGRNAIVTIAGDGPARPRLERLARQAEGTSGTVRFNFTGWLDRSQVAAQLGAADVVVFPSAWPEPFGLVGPEAGHLGIPVAAFSVGGVRGWLVDGLNGYLAPHDPPTADGLVAAIAACFRDERTYQRLCVGALEMASRFSRGNHLQELLSVFERVLMEPRAVDDKTVVSPRDAGAGVVAMGPK